MTATFLIVMFFIAIAYFLRSESSTLPSPVPLTTSTCYCTCSIFSFFRTSSYVTIALRYQTFVSSNPITILTRFIESETFLVMFFTVKFVTHTFILSRLLSTSFLCFIFTVREFSFMKFVICGLIIIVGTGLYLRLACSGRCLIVVIIIRSLKFLTCGIHCRFVDFSILSLIFLKTVYALSQREMVKSKDRLLTNWIAYPNQGPFFHQLHVQWIHKDGHYQTFFYHKKYLSFSYFMTLDFLLTYSLTYLSQLIQ